MQHFEAVAGDTFKPMLGIVQHPVMWRGNLLFGDGVFHEELGFPANRIAGRDAMGRPGGRLQVLGPRVVWDSTSFASELDRAKAVMLPATILIAKTDQISQAGPPIFLETAPFPGTGKSLRVSVSHAAITGAPAPSAIYPTQREEREKVIVTAVMEGHTHWPSTT